MKMNKATKNTTLTEILEKPGAAKILEKYQVPCLFCPMAALEAGKLSLGQIAGIYGLDLKNLLKELNNSPPAPPLVTE